MDNPQTLVIPPHIVNSTNQTEIEFWWSRQVDGALIDVCQIITRMDADPNLRKSTKEMDKLSMALSRLLTFTTWEMADRLLQSALASENSVTKSDRDWMRLIISVLTTVLEEKVRGAADIRPWWSPGRLMSQLFKPADHDTYRRIAPLLNGGPLARVGDEGYDHFEDPGTVRELNADRRKLIESYNLGNLIKESARHRGFAVKKPQREDMPGAWK